MYLIDSNILIRYYSESLPANVMDFVEDVLNKSFNISFINRIEVLGYHALTSENISKLEESFELATEYKINDQLIKKAILVARRHNMKTADAIIAATAIENNLTLLSDDARFNRIVSELKIVNPLIHPLTHLLGLERGESLADFHSLEHRLEFVASVNGVEFVNDSKATTVDAVWYALDMIEGPIIWIAGGVDKGNDYSQLVELVKQKVKTIICLGKDNRKIHDAFSKVVDLIVDTESAEDAVRSAYHFSTPGNVVLLSPACASFDLFENFEERGNKFKEAVLLLK